MQASLVTLVSEENVFNKKTFVTDAFTAIKEGNLAFLRILLGAEAAAYAFEDNNDARGRNIANQIHVLTKKGNLSQSEQQQLATMSRTLATLTKDAEEELSTSFASAFDMTATMNVPERYQQAIKDGNFTADSLFREIQDNRVDVNATDANGHSLLYSAALSNQYEIARYLILAGANADHRSHSRQKTPREIIAEKSQEQWSKLLQLSPQEVQPKLSVEETEFLNQLSKTCDNFETKCLRNTLPFLGSVSKLIYTEEEEKLNNAITDIRSLISNANSEKTCAVFEQKISLFKKELQTLPPSSYNAFLTQVKNSYDTLKETTAKTSNATSSAAPLPDSMQVKVNTSEVAKLVQEQITATLQKQVEQQVQIQVNAALEAMRLELDRKTQEFERRNIELNTAVNEVMEIARSTHAALEKTNGVYQQAQTEMALQMNRNTEALAKITDSFAILMGKFAGAPTGASSGSSPS